MEKLPRIDIRWDGPLQLACAIETCGDEAIDYGVYQIYGIHPTIVPECLLYIGKAQEVTFSDRLRQHNEEWISDESAPVRVHLGRLIGGRTPLDEIWSERIRIAERILIYAHSPPYNSSGIRDPKHPGAYHIFNWGSYGRLMPEVSTARSLDEEPKNWQPYRYRSK